MDVAELDISAQVLKVEEKDIHGGSLRIFMSKINDYKIYNKSGIKIGVFGLGIELEGLVSKDLYRETKYLDPIEIANDTAKKLKETEFMVVCRN